MRLYFKPGACSLASRMVLTELGLSYEATRVDTDTGITETGTDYRTVNPKGYVPALELDDGSVITENPAILQYLAGLGSTGTLAPSGGALARARLQEALNFISSELHKAFSPFFSGRQLEAEEKQRAEDKLARRIADVEHLLSDERAFILGESFSVADAYLFVVLNWTNFIGFDLARWPRAKALVDKIASRPSVRAAMIREGLMKGAAA